MIIHASLKLVESMDSTIRRSVGYPLSIAVLACALAGGCGADDDPATDDQTSDGTSAAGSTGPDGTSGVNGVTTGEDGSTGVDTSTGASGSTDETGTDTDGVEPVVPTPSGLLTNESTLAGGEAVEAVAAAFEANPMVNVAITVDHQANAQSVDLSLPTSAAFVFGNPNLGTPIMVENPLAGLDLPLRLLVWANAADEVFVTYDSPAFLRARYGLTTVDAQLMTAAGALAGFASAGTGTVIEPTQGASNLQLEGGLVQVTSMDDGPTTFSRLEMAIQDNANLNAALVVDHQANAQSVDLQMDFNTVVLFGNPLVGTPLIEDAPTIALDLPLKMAVIEVGGEVVVVYTDPTFLADKHGGIEGQDERLAMVTGALEGLAMTAATTP